MPNVFFMKGARFSACMACLPEYYGILSPILHTIPLQLLAYHTACARYRRGQAEESGQERDGGVRAGRVLDF